MYKIKNPWTGESEQVTAQITTYTNNKNLAIQLWCDEGPYATLTVNLEKLDKHTLAYVDVNNVPNAEEFILSNNLGKPTGKFGRSGFCTYPLYEFDVKKLATNG